MTSQPQDLVITGVGLRCSVGQNAIQSCASIRAGISRFIEWTHFGMAFGEEGVLVVGAPLAPDPGDHSWIEKARDLTLQPLYECLWNASLHENRPGGRPPRVTLYLGTPPLDREGVDPDDAAGYAEAADQPDWVPIPLERVVRIEEDTCAVLRLLNTARSDIVEGRTDVAVVGGFDSHLQSEHLYSLFDLDRLKTAMSPSGLVPGEAGGFVAVETVSHARARGVTALGRLYSLEVDETSEGYDLEAPTTGDRLAAVLARVVAGARCDVKGIRRVLADLNGERWRFLEWAFADARALQGLAKDCRVLHPADCIGDVGAATGAVLLTVAVRAFQRGYAQSNALILATSSDTGARAAACVSPTS